MKGFVTTTLAAALAAGALAAWSVAAPSGEASQAAADKAGPASQRGTSARRPRLPALPAEVRSRGRWEIGVKCDYPPFGYINRRQQNAGYDVDVARRFAQLAFGGRNRVTLTCVTTPSRIPTLQQRRVDIIIATLTWTASREEVIDYSIPYYGATGRLLVPNRTSIRRLRDLNGRTVTTTSGSIYDRWVRRCFPDTRLSVFENFTAARLAFEQRRADTLMWDDTVLLGIATADRNVKLTPDTFLALPYGIGIRQGNTAMKRWVDARLNVMRKRDLFMRILRNNAPRRLLAGFSRNILRPKNTFGYAQGDPTTVCP